LHQQHADGGGKDVADGDGLLREDESGSIAFSSEIGTADGGAAGRITVTAASFSSSLDSGGLALDQFAKTLVL